VRRLSQLFLKHPNFTSSKVSLTAEPTTRYMVNSEGSKIVEQHFSYCILIEASALAKDGMQLSLTDSVNVLDPSLLPDEAALAKKVDKLAESLEQLCRAPVAEPYVGPAILSGRAAAVFFHETFGHRVEALHQKNENEGKTFSQNRLYCAVFSYSD
jgi:predicted Zn-dependent protease